MRLFMTKTKLTKVDEELKHELEDIETKSNISTATVSEVIYPDKKINYNNSFTITLKLKLLSNKTGKISITCPSNSQYHDSKLKLIEDYANTEIYNFAEENIKLPIKYDDDNLKIDYIDIENHLNNKTHTKINVLTESTSKYYLSIIFGYMTTLILVYGYDTLLLISLFCISILFWLMSDNLE